MLDVDSDIEEPQAGEQPSFLDLSIQPRAPGPGPVDEAVSDDARVAVVTLE
jgi:hypothetical protein